MPSPSNEEEAGEVAPTDPGVGGSLGRPVAEPLVAQSPGRQVARWFETLARRIGESPGDRNLWSLNRKSPRKSAGCRRNPLYRRLCRTQKWFRARLTPKPWRCGFENPPCRWPWPDGRAEARYKDWETRYKKACRDTRGFSDSTPSPCCGGRSPVTRQPPPSSLRDCLEAQILTER